jgi:hypothetical protein
MTTNERCQSCTERTHAVATGPHPKDLSVGHHAWVGACDVKVALEKLTEAASRHLRVIPAVHLADVVALDVADAV